MQPIKTTQMSKNHPQSNKKNHLKLHRNLTWITCTHLSLQLRQNWILILSVFHGLCCVRLFAANLKSRISLKFAILKFFVATFLVWTNSKELKAFRHVNAGWVLFSQKLIFSQLRLRAVLIFAYAKWHLCCPRFALRNSWLESTIFDKSL